MNHTGVQLICQWARRQYETELVVVLVVITLVFAVYSFLVFPYPWLPIRVIPEIYQSRLKVHHIEVFCNLSSSDPLVRAF